MCCNIFGLAQSIFLAAACREHAEDFLHFVLFSFWSEKLTNCDISDTSIHIHLSYNKFFSALLSEIDYLFMTNIF